MSARKHEIASDAELNPALADEIGSLRGVMADAAERQAMPSRFTAEPHPERPAMIITDQETGREASVGLYAYSAVREALSDLFGAA